MREGRPYILVAGGADTGRAPLLAVLLRRELAGQAAIASAGVVAHAGEPADPNVQLALEQIGLALEHHIARHLDDEALHDVDLVLAIDRGIARVAKMRARVPVAALSELAGAEDVPDPHRMPLGVWIATLRAYQQQLAIGLPSIRTLARIGAAEMPGSTDQPAMDHRQSDSTAPVPSPGPEPSANSRAEHIERIRRLLETARVLPEIVDWGKLAQEASERLRAIAATATDPSDLTPAAATMLSGLLLQAGRVPGEDKLASLTSAVEQLETPVDAVRLAEIGQVAARWHTDISSQ